MCATPPPKRSRPHNLPLPSLKLLLTCHTGPHRADHRHPGGCTSTRMALHRACRPPHTACCTPSWPPHGAHSRSSTASRRGAVTAVVAGAGAGVAAGGWPLAWLGAGVVALEGVAGRGSGCVALSRVWDKDQGSRKCIRQFSCFHDWGCCVHDHATVSRWSQRYSDMHVGWWLGSYIRVL